MKEAGQSTEDSSCLLLISFPDRLDLQKIDRKRGSKTLETNQGFKGITHSVVADDVNMES